jgi:hypothetical protein
VQIGAHTHTHTQRERYTKKGGESQKGRGKLVRRAMEEKLLSWSVGLRWQTRGRECSRRVGSFVSQVLFNLLPYLLSNSCSNRGPKLQAKREGISRCCMGLLDGSLFI